MECIILWEHNPSSSGLVPGTRNGRTRTKEELEPLEFCQQALDYGRAPHLSCRLRVRTRRSWFVIIVIIVIIVAFPCVQDHGWRQTQEWTCVPVARLCGGTWLLLIIGIIIIIDAFSSLSAERGKVRGRSGAASTRALWMPGPQLGPTIHRATACRGTCACRSSRR
jgi:hypothetical protein